MMERKGTVNPDLTESQGLPVRLREREPRVKTHAQSTLKDILRHKQTCEKRS
jgi:hypothetical protein